MSTTARGGGDIFLDQFSIEKNIKDRLFLLSLSIYSSTYRTMKVRISISLLEHCQSSIEDRYWPVILSRRHIPAVPVV